ncbi:MAG TPA: ABC transporter ATP-binding protein [Bacteroidetes bacterium]|nr:ABC transporter ATP-binding protein [Bacteroidota bacterium]
MKQKFQPIKRTDSSTKMIGKILHSDEPLLEVNNLSIQVSQPDANFFAVKKVGFRLFRGEIFAIVGESGSGKTLTALSVLDLLPAQAEMTGGKICYAGRELSRKGTFTYAGIRGKKVAMIFQNPLSALNPVFRIGRQMRDVLQTHAAISSAEAEGEILTLLRRVGFHDAGEVYRAYSHQLSGGMAQRVMIAMALSCRPELIIADEPTTALDVTTQATILRLIVSLREKYGFSLLLISHDLSVVSELSDRIAVMKDGAFVEENSTRQLLEQPRNEYTRLLLMSIPEFSPSVLV